MGTPLKDAHGRSIGKLIQKAGGRVELSDATGHVLGPLRWEDR
jgi:hypothetical protein